MTSPALTEHPIGIPSTQATSERRERPYRVALLGAGYIAGWHARALASLQQVRLVAVCDKSVSKAKDCADRFEISGIYDSLDEMLRAEDLDAVHVLLPPDLHFTAALQVLDAGVHVFVEKPLCTRAEDCETLRRQATAKGLSIGVGHNFLFSDIYQRLRDRVKEGILGRIDDVTITWNKELGQLTSGPCDIWMLREPENIMLEIGSHAVAHMLDLVGPPDDFNVRATNPIELPTGVPFYRRWQVHAYSGATAIELKFSFIPGFAEHTIHVRGTLGSAVADFVGNTYVVRRHTRFEGNFDRYAMTRAESKSLRDQGWKNLRNYVLSKFRLSSRGSSYGSGIAGAMRAFYGSIGRNADPRISADRGRDIISICQQIGQRAKIERLPLGPVPPAELPDAAASSKILILGATGFIGSELVRQLTFDGHRVRVFVRSASKLSPELVTSAVEVVQGDLANLADLDKAMRGVEVVYHLARSAAKTWADYQKHDVEVTGRIAECCLTHRVRRLIYTSTISAYYTGTAAGTITERTPLDPKIQRRDYYSRAKAIAEELLMQMYREKELPVVIIRPGIVIGRGGSPWHWGIGMWHHNAVCEIWGSGGHKLPIVLVEDVAKGLIAALGAPAIEGQSFNLVGDPCLSAQEYLNELERAAGIKLQRFTAPIVRFYLADLMKWFVKVLVRHPERRWPGYRDWESRTYRARFDCSITKRRLHWSPMMDREEIIRRGIDIPASEAIS